MEEIGWFVVLINCEISGEPHPFFCELMSRFAWGLLIGGLKFQFEFVETVNLCGLNH
jgi:hypothetical protein